VSLNSESFSQHRCWVMAKHYELYRLYAAEREAPVCAPRLPG
jgi:hypothetical protein